MMYNRIFISGHRGFFGKNLIPYLNGLDDPPTIITLDRGSLCNWGDVVNLFLREKPDACINLASYTNIGTSINYPKMYSDNNIDLMNNILEACRESDTRLIQISSSEVYGTNQSDYAGTTGSLRKPMTEEHPLAAHSPYALTKLFQDRAVYSWFKTYGLDASIVRPFNPYGIHQPLNKFISLTIRKIMNEKPIQVFGDGSERRDWTYISDIIRGIWLALNDLPAGEAVNLSTGESYSILGLIGVIRKIMEKLGYTYNSDIEFVDKEPRRGHVHSLLGDYTKAREMLGWEPEYDVYKGTLETAEWIRSL